MRIRTSRIRPWRISVPWVLAGIILAAGAVGAYLYVTRDTDPIPPNLRSQLTFSPFVIPPSAKDYTTTNYKFSTAEGNTQILSYLISLPNNTVTMSEYIQPSQFTEIPQYQDSFLSNVIQQYATVQMSNGTIYLGRLPLQNNKQLGIMIERGLLVFMSPGKEMNSAQWRSLGDQLVIQRVTN